LDRQSYKAAGKIAGVIEHDAIGYFTARYRKPGNKIKFQSLEAS
jgi:hypothetical protein